MSVLGVPDRFSDSRELPEVLLRMEWKTLSVRADQVCVCACVDL